MMKSIFVSYNWAQVEFADRLEREISPCVQVIRDKTTLVAWDSLTTFMKRIRKEDFVVLLISDEYLKSINCMYEISQLVKDDDWDKRAFYVVFDNAKKIYAAQNQDEYLTYWENKRKEMAMNITPPLESRSREIEALQKIDDILIQIGDFLKKVSDSINPEPDEAIGEIIKRIENNNSSVIYNKIKWQNMLNKVLTDGTEQQGVKQLKKDKEELPVLREASVTSQTEFIRKNNIVDYAACAGLVAQQGDWVYYNNCDDDAIYKMHTDGIEKWKLNKNGGSIFAIVGDWIYYCSIELGSEYLYRMHLDGSNVMQLNRDRTEPIAIVKNWIYYICESNGKLYRISTDGNNKTIITNDKISNASVIDDWVYYRNESDNNKLCKISTDGTKKINLNNDESKCVHVDDGWVYYINESDFNKVYKIRTNMREKTKLNDDKSSYIVIANGWVYYKNESDGNKTYKMRIDGNDRILFNDDASSIVAIEGDWMYYINNDDDHKLYRVCIYGTSKMKLSDDWGDFYGVIGDWVYYRNWSEGDWTAGDCKLYRIRTDGTGRQVVE